MASYDYGKVIKCLQLKAEGITIVLTIKAKEALLCNLLPRVHHASHKELSCLYKATITCLKRSLSSNKVKQ